MQLFDYQNQVINIALQHPKFLIGLDMGLGKTRVAFEIIKKRQNSYPTVVICDANKLKDWQNQLLEYCPVVLNTAKNKQIFQEKINTASNNIFIMSYAIFRRFYIFVKKPINLIFDESQALKSPKSQQSKAALNLIPYTETLLLLSGDPISNGYENLFVQMKLLGLLENLSYNRFLDRYCLLTLLPGLSIPRVSGYKNTDELLDTLSQKAFFLKTQDAFLKNDQKALTVSQFEKQIPTLLCDEYSKMLNNKVLEFSTETKEQSFAFSEAAEKPIILFKHLRTLASGFVYHKTDAEEKKAAWFSLDKFSKLEKILSPQNSYVIFYNFSAEHQKLVEFFSSKSDWKVFSLNGKSQELSQALEYSDSFILLVQYQSGARGIDGLQYKIFNSIYFSLPTSGELFRQSQKRIHRIGQKNNCNYFYLFSKSSIESKIFSRLKKGKNYSLNIFKLQYS